MARERGSFFFQRRFSSFLFSFCPWVLGSRFTFLDFVMNSSGGLFKTVFVIRYFDLGSAAPLRKHGSLSAFSETSPL